MLKSVALFCPHSKNFPEAKLKSNGLNSLVEENSRQVSIASITQLLVIILMQDYNEERARGTKIQKCSVERKGPLQSLMVQTRLARRETDTANIGVIKDGSNLHWKKGKGILRARSHSAKLPSCERRRQKEFSALRKEQQTKATANVTQGARAHHKLQLNPKCCSQALAL